MTGAREAELLAAVDMLKAASMDEVFWMQDRVAESFGAVGGWKVGAGSLEATPMAAPMPAAWVAQGGSELKGNRFRGLEAEIAFLMKDDLPPRGVPYTRAEVYEAVASCHPAIEVLESGLREPTSAPQMSVWPDLQMHGGFVYGAAIEGWKLVDWHAETVTLAVDGIVRVERTGSNTSGDLWRLLPWLANDGAKRTGGLKAGQWITTGSWTGCTTAESGSSVDVRFATMGSVALRFE
jgi:2-keto-4-pentenoate hydratase